MPVRPRRLRRHRNALTLTRALALSIGPNPTGPSEADEILREVWAEHGPRILATEPPDSQPWGFWAFSPGVPEELRGGRPALYAEEEAEAVHAAEHELEERRARWLAERSGLAE